MNDFEKTIEKLKKIEGKVRGSCLESIVKYLKRINKESYLPKIEEKLKKYGFEEKLAKIDPLKWYPIAFEVALIFSTKEVLNWGEKEIRELEKNIPKMSMMIKLLAKFLLSPKILHKKASIYWKKHFNFGKLSTLEFNEREKYFIVKIENFDLHSLYCKFLEGYFETMLLFVSKTRDIQVKEAKCTFQGNSFHEFLFSWK
jgi:hypothetical protein